MTGFRKSEKFDEFSWKLILSASPITCQASKTSRLLVHCHNRLMLSS